MADGVLVVAVVEDTEVCGVSALAEDESLVCAGECCGVCCGLGLCGDGEEDAVGEEAAVVEGAYGLDGELDFPDPQGLCMKSAAGGSCARIMGMQTGAT